MDAERVVKAESTGAMAASTDARAESTGARVASKDAMAASRVAMAASRVAMAASRVAKAESTDGCSSLTDGCWKMVYLQMVHWSDECCQRHCRQIHLKSERYPRRTLLRVEICRHRRRGVGLAGPGSIMQSGTSGQRQRRGFL